MCVSVVFEESFVGEGTRRDVVRYMPNHKVRRLQKISSSILIWKWSCNYLIFQRLWSISNKHSTQRTFEIEKYSRILFCSTLFFHGYIFHLNFSHGFGESVPRVESKKHSDNDMLFTDLNFHSF